MAAARPFATNLSRLARAVQIAAGAPEPDAADKTGLSGKRSHPCQIHHPAPPPPPPPPATAAAAAAAAAALLNWGPGACWCAVAWLGKMLRWPAAAASGAQAQPAARTRPKAAGHAACSRRRHHPRHHAQTAQILPIEAGAACARDSCRPSRVPSAACLRPLLLRHSSSRGSSCTHPIIPTQRAASSPSPEPKASSCPCRLVVLQGP